MKGFMSYGPLTKSNKAELAERPNRMETPSVQRNFM